MYIEPDVSWFVKVTPKQPEFRMVDGITLMSRAAIEFSDHCPSDLANQVLDAMRMGWIQPVAYVHKHDYLADRLRR